MYVGTQKTLKELKTDIDCSEMHLQGRNIKWFSEKQFICELFACP